MTRRYFSTIAAVLILQSCDQTPPPPSAAPNQPSTPLVAPSSATSSTAASVTTTTVAPPLPTSGEELAQRSGCFACHAIDHKVVGPPWRDVAARYRGNAGIREQLIEKVRNGGGGNWKEITGGVSMPPYSPRVTDANIAALVDFVLALPAKPDTDLAN